jgi:predicted NBD/HSP70 family sugar kinase
MSSLVIGLDISDSHITSALVRIGQLPDKNLSIERDTYFTRSFEINQDTDPRDIISIWIDCINDLLLDFVKNYQDDDDNIMGISIGIPDPMDYQSGICYSQSGIFNKFFGLNIRLSLEYGLKNLISRWKHDYYTPPTNLSSKKPTILDKLEQKQVRKMTITPPTTPRISITLNVPLSASIKEISEKRFLTTEIKDYCGHHDIDSGFVDEQEVGLFISRSRRETYFHDIEISPLRKFSTTNQFTPKLWSIIERLSHVSISFYNDTTCFALGEINNDHNKNYQRILALTLGTNFGSAFIDQGEIITNREDVPPDGTLWNCPYDQNSIADDWFSTRGLINIYKKLLRHESPDDSSGTSSMTVSTDEQQQQYDDNLSITNSFLIRRASNGDQNAIKAFQTFARLLGQFLIPYINGFHPEVIIIGGSLAQIWYLLEDELSLTIKKFSQVHVYFSLSQAKSVSLGAVQQQLSESPKISFRQTHQHLLPVVKIIDTSHYDIYPTHQIPTGSIGIGYSTLNEKLFNLIEENDILLIDGFVGTYFNHYAHELNKYYCQKLPKKNLSSLLFYDSRAYLQTDSNIQREIYLQDPKSLFGRLATDLDFKKDFIDSKKFNLFKTNLSYPCVVIGPASSYINETSPLVYIDLAKNELYYRIAAQTSFSYLKPTRRLKSNDNQLTSSMYEQKCLYFLDYPIFNKLKQEILPRLNYFIDGQRPNCPTWIDGQTFRQTLVYISNQPIRVRPWFEPGPWGGQWLKTVCKNLSKHSKNYAWSYEMITSENGLILSDVNNVLLELSWDFFYGSQSAQILGNDIHYRLFNNANDFPIRFNFLDTIDGGNLSIQCNPNLQYIRSNFGEKFPQDETYYIIETTQHWKEEYKYDKTLSSYIYLGFQENINPEEFHQALILSDTKKQTLNVEKYIQYTPTNIHDFFLIPNQTIHALGRNQVVLEISSTPYIYTFKLYDWLRLGLDGRPRLLNIEHGMKNLKFDRRAEQLYCHPKTIQIEENKYEEQHLPTHDLHFYDVHRLIIEANESIEIIRSTENRFHLCMLVEGDAIEIEFNSNQDKQIKQYNYIETFLIPASIQQYRLRPIIKNKNNEKNLRKFILLIAFLKWDCEKLLE